MKIFLDMDGVLANFVKGALEAHSLDVGMFLEKWGSYKGIFDICKVIKMSSTTFWEGIDSCSGFWENLEAHEWTENLMDLCSIYGDVFICTTPSLHSNSCAGKIRWLQKHFGYGFRKYILTEYKSLLAGSNRVLIDDRDKNISSFHDAGGNGIVFPQIWNSRHDVADKMEYVKERLEDLK